MNTLAKVLSFIVALVSLYLSPTAMASLVVEDQRAEVYTVQTTTKNDVTLVSKANSKRRVVIARHFIKQPLVTGKTEVRVSRPIESQSKK